MGLSATREKLIGRLRSRRMRPREELLLVEGVRSVEEALDAGMDVRFAVLGPSLRSFERGRALAERIIAAEISVTEAEEEEVARISDTESPQGVLLVCREPTHELVGTLEAAPGRFLVLDAVQDPGNVGTLIRVARAFGLDGVLALDGTADLWSPKAIRASAGASFRVPVLRTGWSDAREALERRGVRLLAAEAGGRDVAGVDVPEPWALVVGNEGAGPRAGVLERAFLRVGIPMREGVESLNVGVAGAILVYVLTRKSVG